MFNVGKKIVEDFEDFGTIELARSLKNKFSLLNVWKGLEKGT